MPLINQIQPIAPVQRVIFAQRAMRRAYRLQGQPAGNVQEARQNFISGRTTQTGEQNLNRAFVRRKSDAASTRLVFSSSRITGSGRNYPVSGLNTRRAKVSGRMFPFRSAGRRQAAQEGTITMPGRTAFAGLFRQTAAMREPRTQLPFQYPARIPRPYRITQNFQPGIIRLTGDTTPEVSRRKIPLQTERENFTYSARLYRAGVQRQRTNRLGKRQGNKAQRSTAPRPGTILYSKLSTIPNDNPQPPAGLASAARLNIFA